MLFFASSNKGKILEVRSILKMNILSLNDLNKKIEIEENGKTFLENAIIKAKTIYEITNLPTIADDSGLEIKALNGFPGVLTKRFLGDLKSDHERNQAILEKMNGVKDRTCYFTCCFAYYNGFNLITSEYKLEGKVALVEKIDQGFGFDSIFLYKNKYLSSMNIEEKNKISPRKKALEKLAVDTNFQKNIDLIK